MTDDERHSAVRRAFTNARRLQAMARDVLDTESIESGQFGYLKQLHRPRRRGPHRRSRPSSSGPSRGDPDRCPTARVVVEADADRIQQVLSNLLDNATQVLRRRPPRSRCRWSRSTASPGSPSSTAARGIDPDQLSKIFDKFVRVARARVTGTGLGLYIARRIVEAHGGRIWAESSPGEETRFIVELPCRLPTGS